MVQHCPDDNNNNAGKYDTYAQAFHSTNIFSDHFISLIISLESLALVTIYPRSPLLSRCLMKSYFAIIGD